MNIHLISIQYSHWVFNSEFLFYSQIDLVFGNYASISFFNSFRFLSFLALPSPSGHLTTCYVDIQKYFKHQQSFLCRYAAGLRPLSAFLFFFSCHNRSLIQLSWNSWNTYWHPDQVLSQLNSNVSYFCHLKIFFL